ncbi:Cysteine proteinase [Rhizoctonia solani]|uniref:Cysteine proteinase n=1 Tax=Rhizoctonia solani TaxID=456999 RepID=A0A8H7I4W8_9AGAM|nr:Cysteine proteinase [Rhizoctonia solani]
MDPNLGARLDEILPSPWILPRDHASIKALKFDAALECSSFNWSTIRPKTGSGLCDGGADKKSSPRSSGEAPEPRPAPQSKVTFEQRREEVDLLCTAELEIARERCHQKVEEIIRDCRERNCRYRDIEFDLEDDQERCLYGLNRLALPPAEPGKLPLEPADVLRVTQIFEEPEFFIDGASSSDVVQSNHAGNSWFMSAVSTVATMKRLIDRICVHRDEEVGVYGFLFYRDSGWVDMSAKDVHEDKERFDTRARVGGKTLYFSRSKTENETWLPLLEKAYAKLHGDYGAIDLDWGSEAVESLTGGVSSIFRVKDILNTERFWEEQLMNANKDRLFACVMNDSRRQINGLVPKHAYSVLEALEVNGKRFLRMRNPWGQSEWNGPWSDGSKEWTHEWLARLPELRHKFGDDGEFLMEYKDFLKAWATIERSRLFDGRWKMSSMWLNVTARTYPCAWSYGDVITFSVTENSPALLVLSKLNDRYFRDVSGCNDWSMDFVVYRIGDELMFLSPPSGLGLMSYVGAPAKQPYTRSYHNVLWRRTVSVELANLEKGDYVLHVRLDRKQKLGRSKYYYQESVGSWDTRKLSKVLTQEAISKSIAVNFDPTPEDLFGGEDLNTLEEKNLGLDSSKSASASESSPSQLRPESPEAAMGGEGQVVTPEKTIEKVQKDNTQGNTNEPYPVPAVGTYSNSASYNPSPRPYYSYAPLPPPISRPIHIGFACNVCKVTPIEGSWYRCLDPACLSYNICEQCLKFKPESHDKAHRFLYIQTEEESRKLNNQTKDDDENSVILGLRIYTKGEGVVKISGQLRQGNIIQWRRKGSGHP